MTRVPRTRDGNPFRVDRVGSGDCITEWVPGGITQYASWNGFAPRWWPDQPPMAVPTRRLWRSARTLGDLGDLTALWLQGRIGAWPGYSGGVDVEEDLAPGLTAALVVANRAGIVTTGSQAGRVDGALVQHAWVDAFATQDTVHRLALPGRYQVIRNTRRSGFVPVTLVDHQVVTSSSWMSPKVIRREVYPGVGRRALAEVVTATQVAILDPEAGRNTLWADLLAALDDAMGASVLPTGPAMGSSAEHRVRDAVPHPSFPSLPSIRDGLRHLSGGTR